MKAGQENVTRGAADQREEQMYQKLEEERIVAKE